MEEKFLGVKGLVVTHGGRCLILTEPNGELDLPGGTVEEGDSNVSLT